MKRLLPLLFLLLAFQSPAQRWKPVDQTFDSLTILCERTRNSNMLDPNLKKHISEMKRLADRNKSDVMKWRSLYWESYYFTIIDRNRESLQALDSAIEMMDTIEYRYDYQRATLSRLLRSEPQNYLKIYKLANAQRQYYESIGDDMMAGGAYLHMAGVLDNMHLPNKAIVNLKQAIASFEKSGMTGMAENTRSDLMDLYIQVGDTLSARKTYAHILHSDHFRRDTIAMVSALLVAGVRNLDPEAIDKAAVLVNNITKTSMISGAAINGVMVNIAGCLLDKGQPREALAILRRVYRSISPGSYYSNELLLPTLKGLAYGFEKTGMIDSAYIYSKLFHSLRDSLADVNDNEKFQQILDGINLQREEERIAMERVKSRNIIALICLLFLFLMSVAIGIVHRSRARRLLKEAENRQLEAHIENERLQRQIVEERCENNERQLTTNTLLLIEKGKMIDHLNRRIEEYGAKEQIDPSARKGLQNFIRSHQGTEDSLRQFNDYFNQVHPDFLTRLKSHCPSLSKGDLRLCAYIRMGLDNKQIAQILSVQHEAIKNGRYRIRKKLGLSTSESLEDFLMALWESSESRDDLPS